MDSRKLRRTLFIVIMMFFMITVIVMMANWELVQDKLGLADRTQGAEPVMAQDETQDKQLGNDLHAFMQDETFFDTDTHYKSIETYSGKNVSLVMSSVAKDLRVMIVNSSGRLVTGAPFSITIQGVGEYTDDDEDGIIYVDELRAGEYSVYMNEIEGYRVPNTKSNRRSSTGFWKTSST